MTVTLTVENGAASITLTFTEDAEFKVYNQQHDRWFGANEMSEDTTVEYSAMGKHANIYLRPGTYKISFDIQTQLVIITPVNDKSNY